MSMQIRKVNIGSRNTTHIVALSALNSTRAQAIDVSNNGTLYMADYTRDVILKVYENGSVSGAVLGHIGSAGNVNSDGIVVTGNSARLTSPLSICVDGSDNIFIGDGTSPGFQIRRMSPSGRVSFMAGNGSFSGDVVNNTTGSNDGTIARFSNSSNGMGLCVDKAGVVYLADTGNHKIKKVWNSGKTTSMAGSTAGFANATGNPARFNTPFDVTVDLHGNVYVADHNNHRIRKVTESGNVFTLAGTGTASFVDGNGATATFNNPCRICIDPGQQFLYVMDHSNSAIRRVDMTGNVTTFCSYNPPASGEGDICVDKSGFLYILEKQ